MIKATMESSEKNKVVLQVEVSADEFEVAIAQAYKKVAATINLPGFRKGKAPRQLIEARYGKEVFFEDAIDIILPKAYEQAIEDTGIDPIDQPHIDIVTLEAGEPFVFKAEVEVKPEVELGEYKGLEVTKNISKVDEHDVDHELEHMREQFAELVAVEGRDTVEQGDFATIDFTGYKDGEPFSGGAAEGHVLEIGSGQFIPGFEDQLIGAKLGDELEINVTFPEEYQEKSLAGQPVVFKVKINEIKAKKLPQLDDEFAKDVAADVETLEALKENIRQRLQGQLDEKAVSDLRSELVNKATDNATAEVPEVMAKRESEHLLRDFEQMLAYQGMRMENYMQMTGQSQEELQKQFMPEAERRVKNSLVLEAIAAAESISVTEEEIDARIEQYINESRNPEQTRKMAENWRPGVRENLQTSKTIDFLVENAKITEVEVSHEHHHHEAGEEQEAETEE